MSTLTIVGLGPGAYDDLTLGARNAVRAARHLILRTERHPCIAPLLAELGPAVRVDRCDDLYEIHAAFPDVYGAIVERIVAALDGGDVVYAVPGHPWVGEATTPLLAARLDPDFAPDLAPDLAPAEGRHTLRLVGGLSFVAPAFAAVQTDLMDGSQVCDAMLLAQQHYPQVEPTLPLLVAQVYARWLAADVKLTLLAAYPADHPVAVIRAAGAPDQAVRRAPLEELDHSEDFDHLTSVYVGPVRAYGSFAALAEIVAHLRAPNGCPWDREQTLASLRKDLLDEAAEVLEAIDLDEAGAAAGGDNSAHIAEELGDLYLVATMLTQIAAEEGRFLQADVMRGIVTKLIRRHPHVFGDVSVDGVERVLANWEAIKAQEKADKGLAPDLFGSIPAALPALEKARKLQSKAAKLGLLDRQALTQADPALAALVGTSLDEKRLGELLWQIVALAHAHGLDAEDALRSYGVHFRQAMAQRLS